MRVPNGSPIGQAARAETINSRSGTHELARTLPPRRGFDPMAYYGDPASYVLERDLVAYYEADLETDALRIQAALAEAAST